MRRLFAAILPILGLTVAVSALQGGPPGPRQPPEGGGRERALKEVTQGQLAVRLAARLGLGDRLTEDGAIGALTAAGIVPQTGWRRPAPATDIFLVQVQKEIHLLLADLARELGIREPATLGLRILTPGDLGGQHFESPQPGALPKPSDAATAENKLRNAPETPISIESGHPYPIGDEQGPVVWSYRLRVPGATALAVRFSRLDLGSGDSVRVVDRFGQERFKHTAGSASAAGAWSGAVVGDTAIILIHADAQDRGWGFQLDRYKSVSR